MKKGALKNGVQLQASWKAATISKAAMANSADNATTTILKTESLSRNGPKRKNNSSSSYTQNTETGGPISLSSSRAGTWCVMQNLKLCEKHAVL